MSAELSSSVWESFYIGKFLNSASSLDENSILKSWLQNRLREHFSKTEFRKRRALHHGQFMPLEKYEDLDIFLDGVRVLDIHKDEALNNAPELLVSGFKCNSTDPIYQKGSSRIFLQYQRYDDSPEIKQLHIVTNAGEILDTYLSNIVIHPYIPLSEVVHIEVYDKVFPTLEDWNLVKNISLDMKVPKCFFAKYEQTKKVNLETLRTTGDDIMSKVAAGMKIDKEEERFESHRLLILENEEMKGFTWKNSGQSSFLPLLNVKSALSEIVTLHACAWAFSECAPKDLRKCWSFLDNATKMFDSYILELASDRFPIFVGWIKKYLDEKSAPDKFTIGYKLENLQETLKDRINEIRSSRKGPLTLIHQGLCSSTLIFKYDILGTANDDVPVLKKQSWFKSLFQKNWLKTKSTTLTDMKLNREVRIIDWMTAGLGSPMIDIAFMFLTCLPPKARKTEQDTLLQDYMRQFSKITKKYGIQELRWTLDDLMEDYYEGLLLGCIIIACNVTAESHLKDDDISIVVEALRELIDAGIV